MPLPKQVQKAIDEAEALEKQLHGKKEEPKQEEPEGEVPEEPKAEGAEEPEAEPKKEPEVEPKAKEPASEGAKKPTDDVEVWKQKYRTLQGMYDKEVPQLHAQVRQLTQQVEELKNKQPEPPKEPKKLVTDEDVDTFGGDLIELQRKVAREVYAEVEEKFEALRKENAELRKLVGDTTAEVKQGSFQSQLLRLVPDFQQVDEDPRWIEWLNEVDPILRKPRRAAAEEAWKSGDAQGVAHYVTLFKKTLEPDVEPQKAVAKKELERQIQPSPTAPSSVPTSRKGKVYTNADIRRMFQKISQLNGAGKLDEANKLEAEIDAAYMEGRVSG